MKRLTPQEESELEALAVRSRRLHALAEGAEQAGDVAAAEAYRRSVIRLGEDMVASVKRPAPPPADPKEP